MPLPRPPDTAHPGQIGLWAMLPLQTLPFRDWTDFEFPYIYDYVVSGSSRGDLENVIGQAHIAATACLASRYDAEIVSGVAVDSYIEFRRDFLELARDRKSGALLHPRSYNSKFVTYVRWRLIEVLRLKCPRDVADALTAHIEQVGGASRPDDVYEIEDRTRRAAAAMRVLHDLAQGDPVILLWLDGELSDAEIAAKMDLPRSTVAPRLSRFRARAREVLISFV